jgi:hypothetical protein
MTIVRATYSPLPTLPDGVLTVCIKVAESEIRALRENLQSAGYDIAAQDPDPGPSCSDPDAGPGAALSSKEMCTRFLCMTGGGALAAAGLAGGLALGLCDSPLFGLGGAGAALAGAALCIGGLVLGHPQAQ